jgi:hypothetical protein
METTPKSPKSSKVNHHPLMIPLLRKTMPLMLKKKDPNPRRDLMTPKRERDPKRRKDLMTPKREKDPKRRKDLMTPKREKDPKRKRDLVTPKRERSPKRKRLRVRNLNLMMPQPIPPALQANPRAAKEEREERKQSPPPTLLLTPSLQLFPSEIIVGTTVPEYLQLRYFYSLFSFFYILY